jgi:tRNA pseudouridine55 synthase
VVARVRRIFRTREVGHTGTLDPFASGLLVLVLGGATRLARWAERRNKVYRCEVRLGRTTDTDDRTGTTIAEWSGTEWPAVPALESAIGSLTGTRMQKPPAYSARRIGGQRSYRLARRGERPEPAATEVTVHRLTLTAYRPPLVSLEAEVSAGTYLRSLARDLGERLGTGAHAEALRRESIGSWSVADAVPLDRLTGAEALLPPLALLEGLPEVTLEPAEVPLVMVGRDIERPGPTEGEAALTAAGRLVAVGRAAAGGWHPGVVLPDQGP